MLDRPKQITSGTSSIDPIHPSTLTMDNYIHEGASGVVYRAFHAGQTVVVKVMPESLSHEFHREKDIMVTLTQGGAHHCIKLLGYCIPGNTQHDPYAISDYRLVMEYGEKGSLAHLIDRNQLPRQWLYRINIMSDITRGLAFIHACQLVHCDIKSPNVVIDQHDRAKIIDFGSAKRVDVRIRVNYTVQYMAPELFRDYECASKKSDIYSLGILFLEIVSMLPPWSQMVKSEGIMNFVLANYREPIPVDCPESIASLIKWCWHDQPDQRPTAEQVEAKLAQGYPKRN